MQMKMNKRHRIILSAVGKRLLLVFLRRFIIDQISDEIMTERSLSPNCNHIAVTLVVLFGKASVGFVLVIIRVIFVCTDVFAVSFDRLVKINYLLSAV
ncbi:MAG: hypothetical protein K2J72_11890, partial [Oscillospiraceae bacterium]|nr:hypothetical protein [Oscillospiraceae bacterium]